MMIDEGLMGALLLSLVYASVSSYIGDPFCIVPLLFLYLLTCARRSRFVTVRGGVGEGGLQYCFARSGFIRVDGEGYKER